MSSVAVTSDRAESSADDARGFVVRHEADGSRVVRAARALDSYPPTVCADLIAWAAKEPASPFLAVRGPGGDGWRTISYGTLLSRVRSTGAGLLRSRATSEAPLAIVAENSIDCAVVMLAAAYTGIPFAPISVGYASATADPHRLRDLLDVLRPGLIYAPDPSIAAHVAAAAGSVPIAEAIDERAGDPAAADAAFARVGPQTIVKIMFTSGSTGTPKGVITTNGMLAANQTQTVEGWPELTYDRPVIVDWLPWSHVMGGSHIFGMVLRNGGTLYVDPGRPVGRAFGESVRTLHEIPPTMFFSVPRGFAMLLDALHADPGFAAAFFSRLRVLGNAGATLPNPVREELIRLARRHGTHPIRVTSSWGMTETAPMATTSWGPVPADDDTIGMPVPGIELKLAPSDGREEIRIKGPNVTPGYWRNGAATRDAFDPDGYFRTGDAATLKDPADPERGIVFAGRLAENFKLSTGTWVNVGALRIALIERGAPLIEDVVVTGHDGDAIGALVFLRAENAAAFAGEAHADHAALARHPRIRAFVASVLADHNAESPGSSTRVMRALILSEPPSRAHGEVTDKGSINQRRALAHRAAAVEIVGALEPHADLVLPRAGA